MTQGQPTAPEPADLVGDGDFWVVFEHPAWRFPRKLSARMPKAMGVRFMLWVHTQGIQTA